ncbi:MAG: chromate transporter [Methanosarcinaceae archaeon]|nr:chromate transporter [Methanosarcinaceae archaeon]
MSILFELFFEFFKAGLFSVGGGLATLPFLYEMSYKYMWLAAEIIPDLIAISESTPGALGVNAATYVGWNAAGLPGATAATLGLVTPSVIIMLFVARSYDTFLQKKYIQDIFYAIRPAVIGLIAVVAWNLLKISLSSENVNSNVSLSNILSMSDIVSYLISILDIKAVILFGIIMLVMRKIEIHPLYYILGSALIGIIFKF